MKPGQYLRENRLFDVHIGRLAWARLKRANKDENRVEMGELDAKSTDYLTEFNCQSSTCRGPTPPALVFYALRIAV